MRPLLASILAAVVLATGLSVTTPAAEAAACRPSKARPTPVVLLHGTLGGSELLNDLEARLRADGFCTSRLHYGNRGTEDIVASAKQLRTFVTGVLKSTRARKVSIVGLSQGGLMPRYYLKFLGGAAKVDDLVGLVPSNHGSILVPDPDQPIIGPVSTLAFCKACGQQAAGSAFLRRLNAGDETPGMVSYTQITTRYDEVVVPYTSAHLKPGPRTTNITLQDLCPANVTDHRSLSADPVAIALTVHALKRSGPASPAFRPAC